LSYTSESRRLLGDPGHPGSMSPKHRPAEMVSKVEFALNMRYVRQVIVRQVIAIRSAPLADCPQATSSGYRLRSSRQVLASVTALSGSLSHSRREKTTHVEKSSGTRPSTPRDSQTGTARSFEPTRSRHLGGTRMHKSRETGTGSFGTRHCQAQFVPTGGRCGQGSEAAVCPAASS